jgi:hypothetical protein
MAAKQHKLDFTKVKDGGNFKKTRYPAGDYKGTITKVEDAKPKDKNDKTPMWLFTIKVKAGAYPFYCKLQENQLWKVRNLFVAAGLAVPKKSINVDPNKVVGKDVAVTLDDTEYDGKEQSEVAAVFPLSELSASELADDDEETVDTGDDDEDETEPEPKAKKGKKQKAVKADEVEAKPAKKSKVKDGKKVDEKPAKGGKGKKEKGMKSLDIEEM